MDTIFYILLGVRTTAGFHIYGQYFLGNDREVALDIFSQLKCNETSTDKAVLHIDFMENIEGHAIKIKTICCNLEELSCNCKLITKEAFKHLNLEHL